jgi:hypothetical protein
MTNVSDNFLEKIKTHFVFSNLFENGAFCEIRGKNTVERGRPQMTTWSIRTACWIPKATNTHTLVV